MYINFHHGDCTFKDQCQAVCKPPCEWGETLRLIQIRIQIQKIHFKSDHILRHNFKEKANLLVNREETCRYKYKCKYKKNTIYTDMYNFKEKRTFL